MMAGISAYIQIVNVYSIRRKKFCYIIVAYHIILCLNLFIFYILLSIQSVILYHRKITHPYVLLNVWVF